MLYRIKPFVPTLTIALILTYCGVQYFTGDKGFFSQESRKIELEQKQKKLAELKVEHNELEARAKYLRADNLSEDLLQERARLLFGYNEPHAYIIRDFDKTNANS
jgi:cell division protein FtsB